MEHTIKYVRCVLHIFALRTHPVTSVEEFHICNRSLTDLLFSDVMLSRSTTHLFFGNESGNKK